ncbi:hypothetical protein [Streptomyces sp. NPDC059787]|uniref:hypothetical protein n=1 Tax=Streptomyces sp. NPDC059787 TaxID=3346947 RepID=UPI00365549CE
MCKASRIPEEDELSDPGCMFALHEAARFAHTADLAARLTHADGPAAPRRTRHGAAHVPTPP